MSGMSLLSADPAAAMFRIGLTPARQTQTVKPSPPTDEGFFLERHHRST
jgi:hypothetical protein